MPVDVQKDEEKGLYYVQKEKKRLYFRKSTPAKKIQKYYGLLYRLKNHNIYQVENEEIELPDDWDLEVETIKKLSAEAVWNYIKGKNIKVVKVFYLYYCTEIKISHIAKELSMSESNVKNILYRTIKDIKENVKIEGDIK